MYSSGVDDETVKTTLRDIGLSEDEVKSFIDEVKEELGMPQSDNMPSKQATEKEEEQMSEEDLDENSIDENSSDESEHEISALDDDTEDDDTSDDIESVSDDLAEKTAEKVKDHIDDHFSTKELHDTSTLTAMEEQRGQTEEMNSKLDVLHEKVSSSKISPETIAKIGIIEKKLILLEKQLGDIQASENALQSLLKKILDVNKEILNKNSKK